MYGSGRGRRWGLLRHLQNIKDAEYANKANICTALRGFQIAFTNMITKSHAHTSIPQRSLVNTGRYVYPEAQKEKKSDHWLYLSGR